MPNPYENPELYKSIDLGGVMSPGTVQLSGHERPIKWKKNDATGQKGASMTLDGLPLGEFTATFTLVRDIPAGIDDFQAWDGFQKLIESTTSGKSPIALPVYHPDLARNGYKNVVNAGVGGMTEDDKGVGTVAVKFSEYAPPKPKASAAPKPPGYTQAVAAGDAATQILQDALKSASPTAQAEAELDSLLKEASSP